MREDVGFTIPGYEFDAVIGQGAFAHVYLATQRQYARQVAVKILDIGYMDDRLRVQFERECAATGGLAGHPNILIVLDAGFTSLGKPYLTSSFCEDGSLADKITLGGPLPVPDVLRIGVKLAGALDTAHRAGLVHRDVKPENVLLSSFGEPMLADWGIATITSRLATKVTMAAMTPNHASPEVLEGKPASASSDIYALGSTLYSLLAGRPPFRMEKGQTILALILKASTEPVPPIPRADVPPELFDALVHAMAKDPAARPESAAAFGHALQQVQYQLGLPYTELVTRLPGHTTGPIPAASVAAAQAQALADDGTRLAPLPVTPVAPMSAPATTASPAAAPGPPAASAPVAAPAPAPAPAPAAVAPPPTSPFAAAPDSTIVRPGGVAPAAEVAAPAPTGRPDAQPPSTSARPDVIDGSSTVMHERHAPVIERPAVEEPDAPKGHKGAWIAAAVVAVLAVAAGTAFALSSRSTTSDQTAPGSASTILGGNGVGSGGSGGTAPGGGPITVSVPSTSTPISTDPSSSAPTSSSSTGSTGSTGPSQPLGDAKAPRALDVQHVGVNLQVQWTDDNNGRFVFTTKVVDPTGKLISKVSTAPKDARSAVISETNDGPITPDGVYCVAVGVIVTTGTPLWSPAQCTDGTQVG